MKIAILTDTFLPQINGVTKTLSRMERYMIDKGIDYKIFIPRIKNDSRDDTVQLYSIPFYPYPECQLTILGYKKLKKELNDYEPDIIHIMTQFTLGLMGVIYLLKKDIPVVTAFTTDFPKYMDYYKINFLQSTMWRYLKWFHGHCDITFAPSKYTQEEITKEGIPRVEIWGRGIDSNRYSPSFRSEEIRQGIGDEGDVILLYVGRIAYEKDIDKLIRANELLSERGLNYKQIIIGDGPLLEDYMKREMDNIIFTGYKSGEELSRYYASADVFTFPSSTETLGNVVLEAMASGLPVIAPLEGGVGENLMDGFNGLAVRAGDSIDIADKIELLIEDEDMRLTLGNNAREFSKHKGWNKIFEDLFARYNQLIKEKAKVAVVNMEVQNNAYKYPY